MSIIEKIQSRSREEWRSYGKSRVSTSRSWIRKNGERALVLGVLLGVFFVVALPLLKWLIFFAIISALFVWNVSVPQNKMEARRGTKDGSSVGSQPDTVVVDKDGQTIYKER